MTAGITYALSACFIWGLIFVIPGYLTGFSSFEVALGRYLFYGLVSIGFFARFKKKRYPLSLWKQALHFSLINTIVYYTFLVLSLRYTTPAITALIVGMSPITIAFYGNWKQKEIAYRSLIVPSILMLIGLVVVNYPALNQSNTPSNYVLGLICGFIALAAWSWYTVANARFLKQATARPSEWATLIGVATLFWVLFLALICVLIFGRGLQLERFVTLNAQLVHFLIGCGILGILCAWVGTFLWNRASVRIPVALAGQLTVFETIFGIMFVYVLAGHFPTLLEWLGMLLLLSGVFYGIRQFSRKRAYQKELTPH